MSKTHIYGIHKAILAMQKKYQMRRKVLSRALELVCQYGSRSDVDEFVENMINK